MKSAADPGFPPSGGVNPRTPRYGRPERKSGGGEWGANTVDFPKLSNVTLSSKFYVTEQFERPGTGGG